MTAKSFLLLAIAALAASAAAQTATPSTESMIQQLQAPRTRSLLGPTRNLLPERVPQATGAAAAPGAASTDTNTTTPTSTTAAVVPQAAETSAALAAPVPRPSLSILIQFDFNSARVRPESQQALANLSQALQSPELRDFRFAVEGHTDAKGGADYNQKLSQQRALAVRDVLKSQGVAEERLQAAGRGATDLANAADPFAAENRRVRIVNLD